MCIGSVLESVSVHLVLGPNSKGMMTPATNLGPLVSECAPVCPAKTLLSIATNILNSYLFEKLRFAHVPLEQKSLHTQLLLLGNSFRNYTHTHQLHNFNCRGNNLCNACVSLVSPCLASMISQKGNYTTIMFVELISNYTHTSYTSIIVGELIVESFPLPCNSPKKKSAAEKRGLSKGVVQEPLRRALFCVFLCSEVIFSCKSHRNFFRKLPLQCRHFLENPLAKNPKTQLLKLLFHFQSPKIPLFIPLLGPI